MDTTYTNVVDASTSQIASDTKFHVAGLDLYYDKFHALKDINIDIPEKQITAFIGPSGCGKSTFLKSLNRMNDLVEGCRITGEVKLGEQDIYGDIDINHLRKRVGMVFQNPNPFPMSIYDNIAYGPRTHGIHSKQKLDVIVEKSLRQAAIWDELKDRLLIRFQHPVLRIWRSSSKKTIRSLWSHIICSRQLVSRTEQHFSCWEKWLSMEQRINCFLYHRTNARKIISQEDLDRGKRRYAKSI